jgi:hypothetical protein
MRPGRPSSKTRTCIETARFFRAVNERIDGLNEGSRAPEADFFCECGDSACTLRIRLTLAEYDAIRVNPRRFLTLPGHAWDTPELQVVNSNERFSLVEEIATALSPDRLSPAPG